MSKLLSAGLFRALRDAGVDVSEAEEAAAEVGGLASRVNLLTWMVGFNLALSVAILGLLLNLVLTVAGAISPPAPQS